MEGERDIPDDPFSEWPSVQLEPAGKASLPVLLQETIMEMVVDQRVDYADHLVDELDDRGDDAWCETALLLIEYFLYSGGFETGDSAATRFLQCQPPVRSLSLIALQMAFYECLRGDRAAAGRRLRAFGPDAIAGAARYVLVVVLTSAGWPAERRNELLIRYCSGIDTMIPGQELHKAGRVPRWEGISGAD